MTSLIEQYLGRTVTYILNGGMMGGQGPFTGMLKSCDGVFVLIESEGKKGKVVRLIPVISILEIIVQEEVE